MLVEETNIFFIKCNRNVKNINSSYLTIFLWGYTMCNISEQVRYQIIAQYRNNTLLINILGQGLYFMRTARQIFTVPTLISGFSQEEAALIGYIVGSESHKI
jgi:hypothetical protein